ncbi:hypothetical protein MIDIC_20062 [Alphaproteobacteria bacterium]
MAKGLWGKLFGDKGYVSEGLATQLLDQDLLLITKLKKNMKNKLLLLQNKFLPYKRAIVETISGKLKQFQRLWHSMFTSVENAFCNLMACLYHTNCLTINPLSLPLLSCKLIITLGLTSKR